MSSVAAVSLPPLGVIDGMAAAWAALFLTACSLAVVLRLKLNKAQEQVQSLELQVDLAARRRRTAMEFFHTLGSAFETDISLADLLRSITAFFMRETQATGGATYILDPENQRLRVAAVCGSLAGTYGRSQSTLEHNIATLSTGEGFLSEVVLSGRPVILNDCVNDPRLEFLSNGLSAIHNALIVPLRFRDQTLGISVVANRLGENGEMGKPFGRFEFHVLEAMSLYAGTAVQLTLSYLEQTEKQRLDFDLRVASDIQRLLQPQHSPVIPGAQISGCSRPAHRLGGDHYDFIHLDESRLGVVVADVSGKGVTGALVMAMCHAVIQSQAAKHAQPLDAVKDFRRLLVDDIPEDRFITMLYGVLNTTNREFSFVRAGHDPLLIYRCATGDVERLAPRGGAIGLHRGDRFDRILSQQTIALQSGDSLVLFTDGLTETTNTAGEEFGIERLARLVAENGHLDVRDLENAIFTDIESFAGGRPAEDDQTLVVIKAT